MFVFVIGAIPGIIMIVLGVKLRNAKMQVDTILAQSEGVDTTTEMNMMFMNLNSYFKIQGILIIIGLVIMALSFIFSLVAGAALFSVL